MADLRGAVGFSSFATVTCYPVTNVVAWALSPEQRRWPRSLAAVGTVGCAVLSLMLPTGSVVSGVVVLAIGAAIWPVRPAVLGGASRR